MLATLDRNLEQGICLAVVVIGNLATAVAHDSLEADKVLHIELVIILILVLLDEYLATQEEVLGTTLGVDVVEVNNSTSLAARVNDANAWGADYFISIHTNASSNPNASGSEAFAYARPSRAFSLGEDILRALTAATGLRNRGMQVRPGLYVLRRTNMPAVLVELGFITSPSDAALMNDRPDLFARGIYNGILQYLG